MRIHIAEATHADIDALVTLLGVLFAIERDFTPDPAAQRRGLEALLAAPARARVFVARHGTAGVIGMVSVQLLISTAIGATSGWIEDMVVTGPHRGRGVGRALLTQAQEWAAARGAGRVQLLADADNGPALAYYRRLGWRPTQLFAWKRPLAPPPETSPAGD